MKRPTYVKASNGVCMCVGRSEKERKKDGEKEGRRRNENKEERKRPRERRM